MEFNSSKSVWWPSDELLYAPLLFCVTRNGQMLSLGALCAQRFCIQVPMTDFAPVLEIPFERLLVEAWRVHHIHSFT